jgi:hypothetical protein
VKLTFLNYLGDQLLRQNRPDAFDQAAAEVPLNAFNRRRRHGFHQLGLEL